MIANIITLICGFATFLVCVALVLHDDYDDGLIGRLALSIIAISAMAGVFRVAEGDLDIVRFSPTSIVAGVGVTLFFLRHLHRFLCYTNHGMFAWHKVGNLFGDSEITKH